MIEYLDTDYSIEPFSRNCFSYNQDIIKKNEQISNESGCCMPNMFQQ
jgi:hypothetical protein